MADYPDVGLTAEIIPLGKRRIDVSDAGGVRGIDLSEATAYQMEVTHPLITTTQRDLLLAFYAVNKAAVNAITVSGVDYNMQYGAAYTEKSVSGSYWTLSTMLFGSKQ